MTIDRRAIYERDRGLCGFCGEVVSFSELHLDHITPRGLGGPTTAENLRVAHAACNIRAGRAVRDERRRLGLAPVIQQPDRVRVIVGVSIEIAERVRALAARERRSLSMQVEVLLERALDAEQVAA